MKVMGTNRDSCCIYCGSTTYGVGCAYSPHKKHVHADDPKRCIYCGSTSFGVGCPYNPFSKKHIHGVEFNQMMKESVHSSFSIATLISRLNEPIIEMSAYKMGLIDESGNRLRVATTEEELKAFTPVDAYVLKIRRMLGESSVKFLNTSVIIEILSQASKEKFNQAVYEKEMKLKPRIAFLAEEYKNIIAEATQQGISRSDIENMFIETFLEKI
jgi:hypothetical protein